jgi:hypothetical protein
VLSIASRTALAHAEDSFGCLPPAAVFVACAAFFSFPLASFNSARLFFALLPAALSTSASARSILSATRRGTLWLTHAGVLMAASTEHRTQTNPGTSVDEVVLATVPDVVDAVVVDVAIMVVVEVGTVVVVGGGMVVGGTLAVQSAGSPAEPAQIARRSANLQVSDRMRATSNERPSSWVRAS